MQDNVAEAVLDPNIETHLIICPNDHGSPQIYLVDKVHSPDRVILNNLHQFFPVKLLNFRILHDIFALEKFIQVCNELACGQLFNQRLIVYSELDKLDEDVKAEGMVLDLRFRLPTQSSLNLLANTCNDLF